MKTSELTKKISLAKDPDLLAEIHATFNFENIDVVHTFKGVSAIYEYVIQQSDGWNAFGNIPKEFNLSKDYFNQIKKAIISFIENKINNHEGKSLKSHWEIEVGNLINKNQNKPVPSIIPQVEFLINVFTDTPNYFKGAYHYIFGNHLPNTSLIGNKDFFYGGILAYEFSLKDHTDLTNRRDAEKKSISQIRTNFQKYLNDSETQLSKHLKKINEMYDRYVDSFEQMQKEKEELFKEWFDKTKDTDWKEWFEEKRKKLNVLEETYEAKLKLEKPAKYWEKKSTKFYKEGRIARNILTVTVIVSAIFVGVILILSPQWIFTNIFKGNELSFVRWAIVFFTLLSLITYAIRALTKYMFSSFHLARDAEERHTLTFFYLALMKDSIVDEKDRQLIMQSLFSRVETGLLKDDSTPTMPNDAVSRLMQK